MNAELIAYLAGAHRAAVAGAQVAPTGFVLSVSTAELTPEESVALCLLGHDVFVARMLQGAEEQANGGGDIRD